MYRENDKKEFVINKLTKLHVITNKQIRMTTQLGGQLKIKSRRGSSGGSSKSRMSRTGSSKLSVNANVRTRKSGNVDGLGTPIPRNHDQWKRGEKSKKS